MKKNWWIVVVIAVGLIGGVYFLNPTIGISEAQKGYMDVSPAKAKELIDTVPDLVAIDVSYG